MTQELRDVWNNFVSETGHTGYQNQRIYEYDQPIRLKVIRRLIANHFTGSNEGRRVLDIGCGSGDFVEELDKLGFGYIQGIDISKDVADIARQRFKGKDHIDIKVSDVSELTAQKESFDLVLCVTVLQHIVDDDMLAQNLRRINQLLVTGGKLIVFDRVTQKNEVKIDTLNGLEYLKIRKEKVIASFLDNNELKVLKVYSFPHLAIYINYTLLNWIESFVTSLKKITFYNCAFSRKEEIVVERYPFNSSVLGHAKRKMTIFFQRLLLFICKPLDYWLGIQLPTKGRRIYAIFAAEKKNIL